MSGALDGLRVLDLTRILAGPLATQIMGDLGARVIKVERPGAGDESREMGPPFLMTEDGEPTDTSGFFVAVNRNKQSIAVDIATPEGQDIIRALAAQSDVVVENFKVGSLAKFGLDHASLQAINPDLVYCSITGFGQTGPFAPKPGYDGIFQAASGFMSVSGLPDGEPGGGPMKVGIAMIDILTAYNTVIAILAALRHRDNGGGGQHIDMALLDCGVAALSHFTQNYLITGEQPMRRGNGGFGGIPSQAFTCGDGKLIFVVAGNNDQYRRLCDALERPDLFADPRFRTGPLRIVNRLDFLDILGSLFAQKPAAHWVAAIDAVGVPVTLVNDVGTALRHPQVQHRGMVVEVPHPVSGTLRMLASPLRLSATPVTDYAPPREVGADTDVVLAELGLGAPDLADLRGRGIIA